MPILLIIFFISFTSNTYAYLGRPILKSTYDYISFLEKLNSPSESCDPNKVINENRLYPGQKITDWKQLLSHKELIELKKLSSNQPKDDLTIITTLIEVLRPKLRHRLIDEELRTIHANHKMLTNCGATSHLIRQALTELNVPSVIKQDFEDGPGHHYIKFPSVNLSLVHGDDLYDQFFTNLSSRELLVPISDVPEFYSQRALATKRWRSHWVAELQKNTSEKKDIEYKEYYLKAIRDYKDKNPYFNQITFPQLDESSPLINISVEELIKNAPNKLIIETGPVGRFENFIKYSVIDFTRIWKERTLSQKEHHIELLKSDTGLDHYPRNQEEAMSALMHFWIKRNASQNASKSAADEVRHPLIRRSQENAP